MDNEHILPNKNTYTASQKQHIKNYRMKNIDALKVRY